MAVESFHLQVGNIKDRITGDNQRIVSLGNLSPLDLAPGSNILGIESLEQFQLVLQRLSQNLGNIHSEQEGEQAYYFKGTQHQIDILKQGLMDRHFYGSLRNFQLLMLPPDMVPNIKRDLKPHESLAFLMEAEMHSTGRGRIGLARRVYGLYVSHDQLNLYLPKDATIYPAVKIYITSRVLDKVGLEKDIDHLIATSSSVRNEVLINGLRNIISAGLPSLGKKR